MNMTDPQNVAVVAEGLLRGTREDGVTVFRGVPYARPPVDALRFRAPQPPEAWDGVRDASAPSSAACQINFANQAVIAQVTREIDPGVPGVIAGPKTVFATYCHNDVSEDCLYLDVWVPDEARRGVVPVYVYYHGGANMVSSGSFELERGARLARDAGVIVVRPNYRLGALGWVHFGLIDPSLLEAINLGVQDQFAALRWVYANIAALGGDPANITIGGESAGATAVSHLLANEAAHPFFRRAILQSFSPFNPWCTQQPEEAEFVARKYLHLLGIEGADDLRAVDPSRLIAVQNVLAKWYGPDRHLAWRALGAVAPGPCVPHMPAKRLSEIPIGKDDLAVMIGFAKDEWLFFRGHTDTVANGSEADVVAFLAQAFGSEGAAALYRNYERLYPGDAPGLLLSHIMSFEFFKLPSLAVAQNLARRGVPVHVFQFSYDLPGSDGGLRATHTGDMPFIFRNWNKRDLASWPGFAGLDDGELDRQVAEVSRIGTTFGHMYAGFLHRGDPGHEWSAFDKARQSILWVGKHVVSRNMLLAQENAAFAGVSPNDVSGLEDALVANVRRHGGDMA